MRNVTPHESVSGYTGCGGRRSIFYYKIQKKKVKIMRLYKREIKEIEEKKKVIEQCKVVRIGSMDEKGLFIVPMNFGYVLSMQDGSLKLYVHSACEGRKAEAFKKNKEIAFEMDCAHELIRGECACKYSYAYRSIMGTGVIHKVEEEQEKILGLKLLLEHLQVNLETPFQSDMLKRTTVYRIDATQYTGKKKESK
ncbi:MULTISPECIES: pyridoxamine 5'-phosphate oxidase family protein [Lachnospiraceae]|jgi:nitroimidazol reductase NimA-like FMN-containing flavoprotein (pyridoxamine 5'-phosphate oxidase superfamily)|uniref:Pyridoxamine 5'-phosphate oxidase family protein n=1 Tax=Faecalicatena acetigenes TaxID=2981790 RepID=A0ABT2TA32_9FIRM|nr:MULTISPECIES: pyridoxamine 5'-phosphate oxidase family protein [Lachnospiraceae]MCU6746727.1 pyridoxamine 5'-phosphate oxidase family protein [Faecalicatena acetigenes]SCH38264.1 Predicted flavin-nucleotide-binding protein [uncultured Clostridium sp.]